MFRLFKVDHKSGDRERRTPGYTEVETDCYGVWEPVTNTMLEDPMGRLIDIDRRLAAQFREISEQPAVNDRIVMSVPADASGDIYTIKSCERFAEQYWSILMEQYKS